MNFMLNYAIKWRKPKHVIKAQQIADGAPHLTSKLVNKSMSVLNTSILLDHPRNFPRST